MGFRAVTTLLLAVAFCCCAQAPSPSKAEGAQNLQTAYCPNAHQLEASPSEKFFLDGAIGKRHVRMYLDRGGSGIVGLFFDIGGDWEITQLGGTWNNGQIEVSDEAENHPATGHLKASLAGNRLTGTWSPESTSDSAPVDLVVIPEPTCDGKEEWKRFESADSLVSFAYPGSWHLEQDREGILLTCPDPSKIAYGEVVTIRMGLGRYKGPPELLQCHDRWLYGAKCDCNHPDKIGCQVASSTRNDSLTVLNVSDREWRVYCRDGGYVGQSYGENRIILHLNGWLEILADGDLSTVADRLTTTLKVRESGLAK